MFCPKCGSQVDDGAAFCGACGAKLSDRGGSNQTYQPQTGYTPAGYAPDMPMKWFKFLIFFALWFGGIVNILSSISYFTGSIYGSTGVPAEIVYLMFPSLRTVNILYGLICIAVGALGIYTRFRLAAFAKNGPKLLYITYGASAAVSLLYFILNSVIVGESSGTATAVGYVIGGVLLIVLNRIYFNKRAHLFVN